MRPDPSLLDLRDRFFTLASTPTSEEERSTYRQRVENIHVDPVLEIDGLGISFHPSARFKAVRFVPVEKIEPEKRSLFARPSSSMPHFAAVFVDPEEYSFRTFENILPLDRWFEGIEHSVKFEMEEVFGAPRHVFGYRYSMHTSEEMTRVLTALDTLQLYTEPLNSTSRGGKRFIFHAANLAASLTNAMKEALPTSWLSKFSHVNPVFRCNRFEPGDDPFHRHIDTPYYDASHHHISRYTMLVYLTGGQGEPALRFGDKHTLHTLGPMSCVVFQQDVPHDGGPYLDGPKVFLRTELIYKDASVTHDPSIARTFAKACYLTGESVFHPELAQQTHDLYDRAAAAHWGEKQTTEIEPAIHKRFRGLDFVSNGYDFWFPKNVASLRECAAIALLDTFNCKINDTSFRKQCTTEVLDRFEPAEFFEKLDHPPSDAEPMFAELDVDALFPPPEEPDEEICCPFHTYRHSWDPARNPDTADFYRRAQRFAQKRILAAPITMMGEEIYLDPTKFVIEPGKIHILAAERIAPVNFAACWNDETAPANYVEVEATVQTLEALVPPILFVEEKHAYHLVFDFFRNSWMVKHQISSVPVPRIRRLTIEDFEQGLWEDTPWLSAAEQDIETDIENEHDQDPHRPWWWEDSATMVELYRDKAP